jgi:ribonuclease Y
MRIYKQATAMRFAVRIPIQAPAERHVYSSAQSLARDIAAKIENELQYPGQIRFTVIRETRRVEVPK